MSEALGLLSADTTEFQEEVKAKRLGAMGFKAEDIEELLAERQQARTDRNWTRGDEIRDQLEAMSIMVMDTPEGVSWRIKLT